MALDPDQLEEDGQDRVDPILEDDPDVEELCERCGDETPHYVSIDMRTESDKERGKEFSREPYRVSECVDCGYTEEIRMNNA